MFKNTCILKNKIGVFLDKITRKINKMTQKAYTIGSDFPPLGDKLRLYSMRFCPYAQRVRLFLSAKQISFETINLNIKRKPEWFCNQVNSQGIVPCISHPDGKVVFESHIINEYLDEVYPDNKLIPSDPFEKAKSKMLIEIFQRVVALLFKAMKFKSADAYSEMNKVLDIFEKSLSSSFFGGETPNITDYMIWPWFERFEYLKDLTNNYELEKSRFPNLCNWVEKMFKLPSVQQNLSDKEQMIEFYKVSMTNQEPNYDIGLDEETKE